jgi:hypothetical protein
MPPNAGEDEARPAAQATATLNTVELALNSRPRRMKVSTFDGACALMNCGRKARKKIATFGLSAFVNSP